MSHKIAINGFGRVGRCILRAMLENEVNDLELVAINDLAPIESLANLLKYDSVHGRLSTPVAIEGENLIVAGKSIRVTSHKSPKELPWADVDIALECTGKFKSRERAALYLASGAKRVLISAPGKKADKTIVFGVNHADLTPADHVVSNASCTTNCLAPLAMVLDREFGIETGYMTTIHAYTGAQPSVDRDHRDPYRARAAAVSMVPTSTGATKTLSRVLPGLKGRIEGSAVRVPTANVSLVDLAFMPKKPASREAVNAALKAAAEGDLKGILSYEPDPMVSVDFNHDPHSCCFAPAQTIVTDAGMVRVACWYDNEWGFANRMIDTTRLMAGMI